MVSSVTSIIIALIAVCANADDLLQFTASKKTTPERLEKYKKYTDDNSWYDEDIGPWGMVEGGWSDVHSQETYMYSCGPGATDC